jgi:hypothetical protein
MIQSHSHLFAWVFHQQIACIHIGCIPFRKANRGIQVFNKQNNFSNKQNKISNKQNKFSLLENMNFQ